MLKKYSIHTILLIILILAGCSTLPKSQKPSTWADKTLSQLSLREKIGQMMVYRMNMQFKDVSPEKWEEINSLILLFML